MTGYPTSKQINQHLDKVGPYTIDELVKPFNMDNFGVCRECGPSAAARAVREMPGRFTFEQAYDFCDYHCCDGYDDIDVVLEELLKKTDCSPDERDMLLTVFGTEKLTDPIYEREREECKREEEEALRRQEAAARAARKAKPGILDLLFGVAVVDAVHGALAGKGAAERSSVFEDVPFQDYNNAWGSNNDHNWAADGDTQWDGHGDGLPSGGE